MALIDEAAPTILKDVCGQAGPKEIVREIIEHPEDCPRVYLFHGEPGVGKTLLARLCAQGANCTDRETTPCGHCGNCVDFVDKSADWYHEFDSAGLAPGEDWHQVRDEFYREVDKKRWRFLVFEEFGAAGKGTQALFLKVLEELPDRTTVILVTTDVQRVIPGIRSRSVEVGFVRPTDEEVRSHLIKVINSVGMDVPEEVLEEIIGRALGRLREAIHLLAVYRAVRTPEAFHEAFRDPTPVWIGYLRAIRQGVDASQAQPLVQTLCEFPAPLVRDSLFGLVNAILEGYASTGSTAGSSREPEGGQRRVLPVDAPDAGIGQQSVTPGSDRLVYGQAVPPSAGRHGDPLSGWNGVAPVQGSVAAVPVGKASGATGREEHPAATCIGTLAPASAGTPNPCEEMRQGQGDRASGTTLGNESLRTASSFDLLPGGQSSTWEPASPSGQAQASLSESDPGNPRGRPSSHSANLESLEGQAGVDGGRGILPPRHDGSNTPARVTRQEGLVPLWGKDAIALLAYISQEWSVRCLGTPTMLPGFLWALFSTFRRTRKTR